MPQARVRTAHPNEVFGSGPLVEIRFPFANWLTLSARNALCTVSDLPNISILEQPPSAKPGSHWKDGNPGRSPPPQPDNYRGPARMGRQPR